MKRFLALLCFASVALAQPTTQPTNTPVQKATATGNLTAGFDIGSGTTVNVEAGGTLANAGTINGAGTFNFGSGTVTLPASVSGGTSSFQALDADLTSIAALTTTANGRSLLTASALTAAGLGLTNGGTIDAWGAVTDSSGLRGRLSDETGTGVAVFATSPTLTTPNIGVATATSVTGPTTTDITIQGGSSGAGIVLGHGVDAAGITLTSKGTGTVDIPTTVDQTAGLRLTASNGTTNTLEVRRFAPPSGWEVATIFGPQGEIKTNASILISGTAGFTYPTGTATMFGVLSDVDGPVIVSRGNSQPNSYTFLGMSETGAYTFAIDLDGRLRWGVGVDKASMDTSLYRPAGSGNELRTPGAFIIDGALSAGSVTGNLNLTSGKLFTTGTSADAIIGGRFINSNSQSNTLSAIEIAGSTKSAYIGSINDGRISIWGNATPGQTSAPSETAFATFAATGVMSVPQGVVIPTTSKGITFIDSATITGATGGIITVAQPGNTAFTVLNSAMSGTSAMFELKTSAAADVPIAARFTPATSKYAWQLAAQTNLNNGFEITPSTSAGGTTFSTPVFSLSAPSGDASFSSTTEATVGGAGSLKTTGGIYAAKKIVTSSDVEVADVGDGIIIKSPDGSRWRITVSDAGAFVATEL